MSKAKSFGSLNTEPAGAQEPGANMNNEFDFSRRQRPDGSHYGTCRKGTPVGPKEKKLRPTSERMKSVKAREQRDLMRAQKAEDATLKKAEKGRS